MKFIHLSDTHLVANKGSLHASDPIYKLRRAVQSINKHQNDVDFVVITGDLTDSGSLDAYKDLKEILDDLVVPYYLIIGNQDKRENFFKVFGGLSDYESSYAHFSIIKNNSLLLFLDTKFGDLHDGGFCEERFEWLKNKLEKNSQLPIYIFMHHPPFEIFQEQMDAIGFGPKKRFWEILSQAKNIKHIFFGHVHLLISGSYRGVGYSSVRSTNHQVALISKDKGFYFNSNVQPTYSIVHVKENQVNCVAHEYLIEEITYHNFVPMKKQDDTK